MNTTRGNDFDMIIIDKKYPVEIHDLCSTFTLDWFEDIFIRLTRRFGVCALILLILIVS